MSSFMIRLLFLVAIPLVNGFCPVGVNWQLAPCRRIAQHSVPAQRTALRNLHMQEGEQNTLPGTWSLTATIEEEVLLAIVKSVPMIRV